MYWITLANTNQYRIYSYDLSDHQLTLIKEELHPENKNKEAEFVSDRPGHYKTSGTSHGAFSEPDHKAQEIDRFLSALASEFENGRNKNEFEQLIFIASPEVNGILSKHLNKHLTSLMCNEVKKDYIHFSDQELSLFLRNNWRELTGK